MEIPIFNSIYDQNVKKIKSKRIKMEKFNNLKFSKPNIKRFPSIQILKKITKKNSLFETVIVSANDELVDLFLKGKINFLDITIFLKKILRMKIFLKYKKRSPKNYNELINLSNYVRLKTRTLCIRYRNA
jgi:1-deoxy-D-xylulose-5-phosphate reductoisomerase